MIFSDVFVKATKYFDSITLDLEVWRAFLILKQNIKDQTIVYKDMDIEEYMKSLRVGELLAFLYYLNPEYIIEIYDSFVSIFKGHTNLEPINPTFRDLFIAIKSFRNLEVSKGA